MARALEPEVEYGRIFAMQETEARTVDAARQDATRALPPGTRYDICISAGPPGVYAAAIWWYSGPATRLSPDWSVRSYCGVRYESGSDSHHILERGVTEENAHG